MVAKRIGGGKLTRSETVTVRLDPKLRYLAELAARQQRRTLSSYIEWAIEESLSSIIVKRTENWESSLADEAFELWDVDEADRFVKLALRYPELLTHEEQIRWKIIQEEEYFRDKDGGFFVSMIRSEWEKIIKYAAGEIDYKEFKADFLPF